MELGAQRDARMQWWREARFGLFIHWSLFAVPEGSWKGRQTPHLGEWIMHDLQIPVAEYKALADTFNPTRFDADEWVSLAKAAGMKYIVFTTKHHDGFAMFRSATDHFNIVDATPYRRDVLRELCTACEKHGLKLGFYYSQDQDWTAPGGNVRGGKWDKLQEGAFAEYLERKCIPQLRELLTNYRPRPDIVWFDTPSADMTPGLAGKIADLLRGHPNLIWNNRLGGGEEGDTETPEEFIPPDGCYRDWETSMNINDTWGYKSFDTNFKSAETLIRDLVDIASKGGNFLLNVGPTPEGVIPHPEVDVLLAMGEWLKVNGEAIYGTTASPFMKQLDWGRATQKAGTLYLFVFDWPHGETLLAPISNEGVTAELVGGQGEKLHVDHTADGLRIRLPAVAPDSAASVIQLKLSSKLVVIGQPAEPPPKPVVRYAGVKRDGVS